jgi:hypothetical protein
VQSKSAVDFIVDSVKQCPGEVAIPAIGPLTNIALATRQHPEIVPMIKQIIYMGGYRRRRQYDADCRIQLVVRSGGREDGVASADQTGGRAA